MAFELDEGSASLLLGVAVGTVQCKRLVHARCGKL